MASPTPGAPAGIIPPGAANQRQQVQYRYVYRSSATGALSNPSPESSAITLPVASNTVTSLWSNDPQIDLVDYYRVDSTTSAFTYVATGPNDNSGSGTNTPIVDSLSDLDAATNPEMNLDDFEPVPSIDLGAAPAWVDAGDRRVQVLAVLAHPRVVLLGGLLDEAECDALIAA